MYLQFFLAFALRNNLVQELVLTRLLEMSKPHLLCQKQYLFSFLSSEASAYVLFNPILSLQFIGLRRHILYWTNKISLTNENWESDIVFGVYFFKFFDFSTATTVWQLTSNFFKNFLFTPEPGVFTFCKMGARQLFSVWINRNITMNNQATFHMYYKVKLMYFL